MTRPPHRADIQGLRALAILLVVSHHAWPSFVPGGYIGVDIFFVISGYLITRQLMSVRDLSPGSQLAFFYSRRVRRILPVALLVILSTVGLAFALFGPVIGRETARDGLWAAVFAANLNEIQRQTDYFASPDPSLLRHYWSLAVEEQFYIVWPLLFILIIRLARSHALRIASGVVLTAVCGSFALAVWQGSSSPVTAYFGTATRVWQIGAGVLVALMAADRIPRYSPQRGRVLGLAALIAAALLLAPADPEPVLLALLVVGPTVLLLMSNEDFAVAPLLGQRAVQYIGDISFSWYLWHWPILEIARRWAPEATALFALWAVLLSFGMAVVTHHLWENPLRFRFSLQPAQVIATGVAIVAAIAMSMALMGSADRVAGSTSVAGDASPPVTGTSVSTPSPTTSTAAISDTSTSTAASPMAAAATPAPRQSDLVRPSAPPGALSLSDIIDAAVGLSEFPASIAASAQAASQDRASWLMNGCSTDFTDSTVRECIAGDVAGTRTMVVYGDSHASMWMTALDAIARDRGFKVHLFAKLACPLPREVVWSYQLNRPFDECALWQEQVLDRIAELSPDVIIVTNQFKPAVVDGKKSDAETVGFWRREFPDALSELKTLSQRVIVLGNNPSLTQDPIACATNPRATPIDCMASLNRAGNGLINGIEQSASEALGITYVDTVSLACNRFACPIVINGIFAYFDQWHFTDSYVRWLRTELEARLGNL